MTSDQNVTVVDGHVHVRERFDVSRMLSAALRRMDALAGTHTGRHAHGVFLLAESSGEESFARLAAADRPIGRWRFRELDEAVAVEAERDDGRLMTLINGRQWTCDDKLEVLTLGSDARLSDGMPFDACLDAALEHASETGALVVLPWGFGKWTGERGARVAAALERLGTRIAIGDSAARPGGRDAVIEAAKALGVAVVPGTDPLPISSHAGRAGGYGMRIAGHPPAKGRWAWLREQIASSQRTAETIGSRDGWLRALATQVRLRLG
ncbi:MAG: hypothetical protein AAFR96_04030 [Planctomycetota bacterium]